MERVFTLDNGKIEYLQEELIQLFVKFQKVVDDFAINRISVKKKKRIGPGEDEVDTEWFDELWRLEHSPEYCNLNLEFESFRRIFIADDDPYLKKSFPNWSEYRESYLAREAIDNWFDLDSDEENSLEAPFGGCQSVDPSSIGLWCRLSGFYYCKLAKLDLGDWQSDFSHLLCQIPAELGWIRIILAFGELPPNISFNSYSLAVVDPLFERAISCIKQSDFPSDVFEVYESSVAIHGLPEWDECIQRERINRERTESKSTEGESETHESNHDEWINVSKDDKATKRAIRPPRLFGLSELKSDRSYSGQMIERRVHIAELNRSTIGSFWTPERQIFQLCCDEKCQLSFQAIVSATLLEPICSVVDLNPLGQSSLAEVERSRLLDIEIEDLHKKAIEAGLLVDAHSTPTRKISKVPRERGWLGPLFDELISAQRLVKQFGLSQSLDLFERANTESNHTAEFILYMTVLESLFLGGSSSSTTDVVSKRFARMVAENREDNLIYKTRLKQIFKLRNDIVHGNDPTLYDSPFPSSEPDTIIDGKLNVDDFRYCSVVRGICRRSIVSFLLILVRLRADGSSTVTSPLFKMIDGQGMAIPGKLSELRDCMTEVEKQLCAREFWSSLQLTLQSEISRFGKPSEIFDDQALLRGF